MSVAYGGIFLYSAYTKLEPVQVFEYTLVEFIKLSWFGAAVAARLLPGLEAGLGLLIILHIFGRFKWVLWLSLGLLILFSCYLVYLWINFGNDVNCGCFGDNTWMSPRTSLTKNLVLAAINIVLLRWHKGLPAMRLNYFALPVLAALTLVPLIVYAIPGNQPSWNRKDVHKIDLSNVYASENKLLPKEDLTHGKKIIAFLSPNCPHCRLAAYKMHLLHQQNHSMPFFLIIGGTQSDLTDFWKKTEANDLPWSRMDKKYFLSFTGGVFPLIIWVDNSVVVANSTYIDLGREPIEKWLNTITDSTVH